MAQDFNRGGRYSYINKTTTANQELITKDLFDPRYTNPRVKKMSINVDNDCFIVINNEDRLLVKSALGLNISYDDRTINSLVCETPGVAFYAILAY